MLGALGKLGVVVNGISLPRRVRNILSKYNATLLMPGAGEPVLGPELVVNGSGDDTTGWSGIYGGVVSTADGNFVVTCTASQYAGLSRTIPLVAGRAYQFSYRVVDASQSSGVYGFVSQSPDGSVQRSLTFGPHLASGEYKVQFAALYTGGSYVVASAGSGGLVAGETISFSSISVREILSYTNTYSSFVSGNYVESTGQTLTPVDGAVGLVVDAAGSVGSELIPDGNFSAGVGGWTEMADASSSVVDGELVVTRTSGFVGRQRTFNAVANRTYVIEGDIARSSGTGVPVLRVRTGSALTGTILADGIITSPTGTMTRYRVVFQSTVTGVLYAQLAINTAAAVCRFNNISIRELPGIHATQPTTQNKPALRRGLVNLLTYSDDFGNAAWVKTNTTYSSGKLLETYSESSIPYTATQAAYQATANQAFTYAFIAKKAERSRIRLWLRGLNSGNRYQVGFNLNDGTILPESTVVGNFTSGVCSATNLGNDRYLCVASAITGAGETAVSGNIGLMNDVVSVSNAAYIGTPGYGAFIESAALFKGTVTAEEILAAGGIPVTTTAPASSAMGPQYWQFDGVDDRLQLSAVPFQMSDDHFVVVGATRGATGATRRLFHVGHSNDTPRVACVSFTSDGKPEANWRNTAGNLVSIVGANTQPEQPVVLSATSISLAVKLRADSSLIASGVNPGGDTTLTLASIGAHTVPSAFHNGQIHGVIFGKGAISDSELLILERFLAKLQGRTL